MLNPISHVVPMEQQLWVHNPWDCYRFCHSTVWNSVDGFLAIDFDWKYECCSLHIWSSDFVVSALSFAGCRTFLPCRNLLARSCVQNATFDENKRVRCSAHAQTCTAHKPSDCEAVRWSNGTHKRTQHVVANTQHQNRTMVKIRERRYNSKYPCDVAATILVSNETLWYMLPMKLIITAALHTNTCRLARYRLLAQPEYTFFRGRRPAEKPESWVLLSTGLSWKSPQWIHYIKHGINEHMTCYCSNSYWINIKMILNWGFRWFKTY